MESVDRRWSTAVLPTAKGVELLIMRPVEEAAGAAQQPVAIEPFNY